MITIILSIYFISLILFTYENIIKYIKDRNAKKHIFISYMIIVLVLPLGVCFYLIKKLYDYISEKF